MTWIDIMGVDATRQSRWDKHDGETAIGGLDAALSAAGLPGRLEPAMKLLRRAEDLAAQARDAKAAARARLEDANRSLHAEGPVDTAGYAAVLIECGPWLNDEAAGMVGVMQAAAQIRGNATQTAYGMASGLHSELQHVCADVVAEAAAIAALPDAVWSATSGGRASELAMRLGFENAWAQLVRVGARWDAVHNAAQYLRETGTLQGELLFAYPTAIATQFLNPSAAMDGLDEVRRLPAALRLRAAIDKGWLPGLWLRSDHDAYAAEQRDKPKRKLLAALVGGSRSPADPAGAVADEFSA